MRRAWTLVIAMFGIILAIAFQNFEATLPADGWKTQCLRIENGKCLGWKFNLSPSNLDKPIAAQIDLKGNFKIGHPEQSLLLPDFFWSQEKLQLHVRSLVATEVGDPPEIALRRVNGTAPAPHALPSPPLNVKKGEEIGRLAFQPFKGPAAGGGSYTTLDGRPGLTASISSFAAENATQSASGGNLVFSTTKVGTTVTKRRMELDDQGRLTVYGRATDNVVGNGPMVPALYGDPYRGPGAFTVFVPTVSAGAGPGFAVRDDRMLLHGFDINYDRNAHRISFETADSDTRGIPLSLSVEGTIEASNKNFVIKHPLKKDALLVHSSLEGPENGVYYRGTSELVNGKASVILPDYFEALTHREGRTVQVSPIADDVETPVSRLAATSVKNGRFSVIAIDSANSKQKFSWVVMATRKDIPRLQIERTREEAQ